MKPSFYLKIFVMIASLVGVFYFINALKSGNVEKTLTDPESAFSLLIGGEYRPTNWCPENTVEVILTEENQGESRVLTTAADISSVCEIMMGALSSEGLKDSDFSRRLVAKNVLGEVRFMEQIPGTATFRFQGLPFSSPMLLKSLNRRTSP